MRTNGISIQNNLSTHLFEGEFDLSAAAAVTAVRGDSITVTKTGVGSYTVRVAARDQGAPPVVEVLNRHANLSNGTPAGALGVKVMGITVDTAQATKDDILIAIVTTATAGGTGAAADTTAVATVDFQVKVRTRRVV